MNVRTMNISDYDSVYALWMSCRNMGFNNVDDSHDGIECFLERNPSTCFVAEINGEIAGVIISGMTVAEVIYTICPLLKNTGGAE